jgi:hypothetical protein
VHFNHPRARSLGLLPTTGNGSQGSISRTYFNVVDSGINEISAVPFPSVPGTVTTSPGFNKVVILRKFRREKPRGIGGNIPHVFVTPRFPHVHDALRISSPRFPAAQGPQPYKQRSTLTI